jgi:mono/diheme cytochrome c family protein
MRAAAMIAAISPGPRPWLASSPLQRPQLYERFCASCHGEAGFGDGPVAPALKVMIPDLTRMYQRNGGKFPEERVRRIIDGREVFPIHGSRYMPVWGQELWVEQGASQQAMRT